jgi:hypothetical protein
MERISRQEFLDSRFSYERGQHLALISSTGSGKTHLAYQLLDVAMDQNPDLSVVSLMPKPADPTTEEYARKLNLRITDKWPPAKRPWKDEPDGYVLWPKHPTNVEPKARREAVGNVLKKGLDNQYWQGNSITFLDDAHSAAVLMDLNSYLEEVVVNGRAGGAGLWCATQKPSGSLASGSLSSFVYSNSTHLFFAKDNDDRNIERIGQLGSTDHKVIEGIIRSLRMINVGGRNVSEQLYVNTSGPYYQIIEPY